MGAILPSLPRRFFGLFAGRPVGYNKAAVRCPYCKEIDKNRVIDSRLSEGGNVIRRRRECDSCKRRFTTKERIEAEVRLQVVKKDGTRMPFDRSRLLVGLQKACFKRPVSQADLEGLVNRVEEDLFHQCDREVSSRYIGELAARHLRQLDQVAYVRFASVYREFQDLGDFVTEVEDVIQRAETETPGQQSLF